MKKASKLLEIWTPVHGAESAKAKVLDLIAKGQCEDDAKLTLGGAAVHRATLIEAGFSADEADAECRDLIAKGTLADDLGSSETDALTAAVASATADMTAAAAALDGLAKGEPVIETPDLTDEHLASAEIMAEIAKGAAANHAAIEAQSAAIVKAHGDGFAALVKAQKANLDLMTAIVGELRELKGQTAIIKGGQGAIARTLATPVAPRALRIVDSPYDPKKATAADEAHALLAKAQAAIADKFDKGETFPAMQQAFDAGDLDAIKKLLTPVAA